MENYRSIPGRGLLTSQSIEARIAYLNQIGFNLTEITNTNLNHQDLRKNIESLIGSVELPVGIVGPLSVKIQQGELETVYTAAGTLEGALIASMNRGAKALSLSGGCETQFYHQRMLRVPMFFFQDSTDAAVFFDWIHEHYQQIKECVELYSNHAKLIALKPILDHDIVHVEFVYTTGDASGQNMTTTCTWHGIQWIDKQFECDTNRAISDYIIEGNGSSDKKVSAYLSNAGRGCKVSAKAVLSEAVIHKILRTNSSDLIKCIASSRKRTKEMGMLHYNINVANAIAAIFVVTGQDLASIHESSLGELTLTEVEGGIGVELVLPSLVVGTVGGGTHLSDRQESLELMGCRGSGKVERFAQLIAAFSLALEISTYSAIVSGEFAHAHEKLGRNKPVEWLTKSEITESFVRKILAQEKIGGLKKIHFSEFDNEKGILTLLSQRVNRKLIGFIPCVLEYAAHSEEVMLKNKPTDLEVVKGLHLIASGVNAELADLFVSNYPFLEYKNCHSKEIEVYRWLCRNNLKNTLGFYGDFVDEKREIFLLALERLDYNSVLMDTENRSEVWTKDVVCKTIEAISGIHLKSAEVVSELGHFPEFDSKQASSLYLFMSNLTDLEYGSQLTGSVASVANELLHQSSHLPMWKCLIHNDFNPRNIALKNALEPVIYDWELALIHYPQRDIVELLSFVADQFSDEEIVAFFSYYEKLTNKNNQVSTADWWKSYHFTLQELIVTRLSFYVVADMIIETKFALRVMNNAFRIHEILVKRLELL